MDTRPSFQFESVSRLERQAARERARAVLPEMANITEHSLSLSAGRTAQMRGFDPGASPAPSPGAVLISGSADGAPEDAVCRYLAEALSLPVVNVRLQECRRHDGDNDWIAEWLGWCRENGPEVGLDPARLVLGARGSACGSVLSAISAPGALDPAPRGLFFLCGEFHDIDARFVNLVVNDPGVVPPTYIASGTIGPERPRSRRMWAYLLERRVECWLSEWPGVTARCLDHIELVPEMERYIDAMVTPLRGLLLSPAPTPRTGAST